MGLEETATSTSVYILRSDRRLWTSSFSFFQVRECNLGPSSLILTMLLCLPHFSSHPLPHVELDEMGVWLQQEWREKRCILIEPSPPLQSSLNRSLSDMCVCVYTCVYIHAYTHTYLYSAWGFTWNTFTPLMLSNPFSYPYFPNQKREKNYLCDFYTAVFFSWF